MIQADGGTRTAAVTGSFIALVDAVKWLLSEGTLTSSPLMDFVAATSAGIVDGRMLLDLAFAEDSQAEVDMNFIMTGDGRIIEVQGTAEANPFSRSELGQLFDLASTGIKKLILEQKKALGQDAELVGVEAMTTPVLVLASHNLGKVEEFEAGLADLGVKLMSLADFPDCPEIEEDGDTFADNALKKRAPLCLYRLSQLS